MIRHLFFSFFTWIFALALVGCGAAQSKHAAESPDYGGGDRTLSAGSMAPGAMPMEEAEQADYDGDAVADVGDEIVLGENSPAPKPMYREDVAEPAPVGADSRVAQNVPPAPPPPPTKPSAKKPPADPVPGGKAKPEAPSAGGGGKAGTKSDKKTIAAPMLIYTAEVNLAVFEVEKILDNVEKLAKDAGGYLVERQARRIVIRVPSRDFDGAMLQIAKLGDVLHKNVSVEDVTEEYFDLQVRIRNLQAVRDRLEQLLKKADKVPDAIAVERELQRVTTQLERLKGRMKLIGELVQFSTITVNVSPRHTEKVGSKVRLPFPWLNSLGLGRLLRL